MRVRRPKIDMERHARLGTEIYEQQVRPRLGANDRGKVVAIDVESGSFEIAENTLAASKQLLRRAPDAQIWCTRVGFSGVHRFGSRVQTSNHP